MSDRSCSILGCTKPVNARGWCKMHYGRFTRNGDPTVTTRRSPGESERCSIEGCDRPHLARGLCNSHWKRWWRHGDPLAGQKDRQQSQGTPTERFWSKVDRNGSIPIHTPELGRCWLWIGATSHNGHGVFDHPLSRWAYRIAYELLVGPIPEGLQPDHLCRNPACVNPAHLEPVTCRENVLRGIGPTAMNARKTHCINGHEFTPENTRLRPTGGRSCRTCARELARKRRRKGVA